MIPGEGAIHRCISIGLPCVALLILLAGSWHAWSVFMSRDAIVAKWPGVQKARVVDADSADATRPAVTLHRSAAQTDMEFSLQRTSPISTSSIEPNDVAGSEPEVRRSIRRKRRRLRRSAQQKDWIKEFHRQQH